MGEKKYKDKPGMGDKKRGFLVSDSTKIQL